MNPLRRICALLLVLAYLVVGTAGASWVICTEADGSVTLERIAAACCDEGDAPAATHAVPTPTHDATEDGRAGCDDAPLLDGLSSPNPSGDRLPDVVPAGLVDRVAAYSARPPRVVGNSDVRPGVPPPNRCHRKTIVLRL